MSASTSARVASVEEEASASQESVPPPVEVGIEGLPVGVATQPDEAPDFSTQASVDADAEGGKDDAATEKKDADDKKEDKEPEKEAEAAAAPAAPAAPEAPATTPEAPAAPEAVAGIKRQRSHDDTEGEEEKDEEEKEKGNDAKRVCVS